MEEGYSLAPATEACILVFQPPLCLAAPAAPYFIFLSQTGSTLLGGLASIYSMQADGNACNDDDDDDIHVRAKFLSMLDHTPPLSCLRSLMSCPNQTTLASFVHQCFEYHQAEREMFIKENSLMGMAPRPCGRECNNLNLNHYHYHYLLH